MILLPVGLQCENCARKWIGYVKSVTDNPPDGWDNPSWDGWNPRCPDCVESMGDGYYHRSDSAAYFAVIEVPG